jgi:hypothetical protein
MHRDLHLVLPDGGLPDGDFERADDGRVAEGEPAQFLQCAEIDERFRDGRGGRRRGGWWWSGAFFSHARQQRQGGKPEQDQKRNPPTQGCYLPEPHGPSDRGRTRAEPSQPPAHARTPPGGVSRFY